MATQAMKCFHAAQLDKSGDTMKPKLNGARPKATMEPGQLELQAKQQSAMIGCIAEKLLASVSSELKILSSNGNL